MLGEANRHARGLCSELQETPGHAMLGIISNLETKILDRVKKVEGFLEAQKGQVDNHGVFLKSLHQARSGEEQTIMAMFGWLDKEIKRLNKQQSATDYRRGPKDDPACRLRDQAQLHGPRVERCRELRADSEQAGRDGPGTL